VIVATSFNPVGGGLIKSFARLENNITGRTKISVKCGRKILKMLRDMAPTFSRQ